MNALINKTYLENSFKDFDTQILEKKYLNQEDPSIHTHDNKDILDRIGESTEGKLLFNEKEIVSDNDSCVSKDDVLSTSTAVKENTQAGKLVDALVVKDVFQSVSNGKELIASAITDKGVETDATATFDVMAENIRLISNQSAFPIEKKSFSDASDTEIAALLEAHYAGIINIKDYWNVGDTRTIHLSDMGLWQVGTNKNGETHTAQDVEIVIIGFNVDDLVTPINGKIKAAITVQLKSALENEGMIDNDYGNKNDSHTSYSASWLQCKRRTWINTVFKESLPTSLQSMLKQVTKTAYGMRYTFSLNKWNRTYLAKQYSDDYCFLLTQKEANIDYELSIKLLEANGYKQGDIEYDYIADGHIYDYYLDSNNQKRPKVWWTRTPSIATFPTFDTITPGARLAADLANLLHGIVPAFCL